MSTMKQGFDSTGINRRGVKLPTFEELLVDLGNLAQQAHAGTLTLSGNPAHAFKFAAKYVKQLPDMNEL
jgi:hypothetical protein